MILQSQIAFEHQFVHLSPPFHVLLTIALGGWFSAVWLHSGWAGGQAFESSCFHANQNHRRKTMVLIDELILFALSFIGSAM